MRYSVFALLGILALALFTFLPINSLAETDNPPMPPISKKTTYGNRVDLYWKPEVIEPKKLTTFTIMFFDDKGNLIRQAIHYNMVIWDTNGTTLLAKQWANVTDGQGVQNAIFPSAGNIHIKVILEFLPKGILTERIQDEVDFDLVVVKAQPEWKVYKLSVKDQVFKIPYKITNADIIKMEIYPDFTAVIVTIKSDPKNDGAMEITLARNLLDAKTADGRDDRFTVLANGDERDYKEVSSSPCFRTLSTKFPAGTKEIEFIVTMLPEIPRSAQSTVAPVYVTTDKSNYEPREIVKVSGCTNLALDDKTVILDVVNPEGRIKKSTSVTPNIDGTFSTSLVVEDGQPVNGSYTVKATYAGQGGTTSFVIPEFPVTILIIFTGAVSLILITRLMSKPR